MSGPESTSTTTLSQSGPKSNNNDGVLHIPQKTGVSHQMQLSVTLRALKVSCFSTQLTLKYHL